MAADTLAVMSPSAVWGFLPVIALAIGVSGCESFGTAPRDRLLLEREAEWTRAMREHDLESLDDLLAAEFRLTFVGTFAGPPGGKPEIDRQQWLANLAGMTFGAIEMQDEQVTRFGHDVAAVRMRMVLHDWRIGDHPLPADYDLTDVWVHRDGRWQIVNRISEPREPQAGTGPGASH